MPAGYYRTGSAYVKWTEELLAVWPELKPTDTIFT